MAKIVDSRRITPGGLVRRVVVPSRLRVPYKRFQEPAAKTWRHVSTHLERNLKNGSLQPGTTWTLIWGLALSTRQRMTQSRCCSLNETGPTRSHYRRPFSFAVSWKRWEMSWHSRQHVVRS